MFSRHNININFYILLGTEHVTVCYFSLSSSWSLVWAVIAHLYRTEAFVQRCSVKKVFLNVSRNQGKTTVPESATLLKKRLWHRCFLVNFLKFLRNSFYRTPAVGASDSTIKRPVAIRNSDQSRKLVIVVNTLLDLLIEERNLL